MGQTANTLGFKGHLVSVSTPGTENKRKNNSAIVAERQKAAIDEMKINRCGCFNKTLFTKTDDELPLTPQATASVQFSSVTQSCPTF